MRKKSEVFRLSQTLSSMSKLNNGSLKHSLHLAFKSLLSRQFLYLTSHPFSEPFPGLLFIFSTPKFWSGVELSHHSSICSVLIPRGSQPDIGLKIIPILENPQIFITSPDFSPNYHLKFQTHISFCLLLIYTCFLF